MPTIELYAADIDPAAVRYARRNIGAHGHAFEGDLYEPLPSELRGRVDVLVETSQAQAPLAAEIFRCSGLVSHIVRSDELDATVVVGAGPR